MLTRAAPSDVQIREGLGMMLCVREPAQLLLHLTSTASLVSAPGFCRRPRKAQNEFLSMCKKLIKLPVDSIVSPVQFSFKCGSLLWRKLSAILARQAAAAAAAAA